MINLFPDQQEAVTQTLKWMCENDGNPVIVAPTGSGKSVIISGLIAEIDKRWGNVNFMVLAHVKELVAQNQSKLALLAPHLKSGIYCNDLGRKEVAPVIFGSVQSVARAIKKLPLPDLLIIDESHLCSPSEQTSYQKIIRAIKQDHSSLKVVGLTATPFRTKEGSVVDGKNFHGISYEIGIKELIASNRICKIVGKAGVQSISTKGFRTQMGDYRTDDVEREFATKELKMLSECLSMGGDRKSWLIFAASLNHGDEIIKAAESMGVTCRFIRGDTPAQQRDKWIQEFKRGEIRALVNYGVLTTGFDAPNIDFIALMRSTKSRILFEQMVGRGMRVAPGKQNCLIADFGSNFSHFGPIDGERNVRAQGQGEGEAPTRTCEDCQYVMFAACTSCPECGKPYPREYGQKVDNVASTAPVMVIESWVENVRDVDFGIHVKNGLRSLRVSYRIGLLETVQEYIPIDHPAPAIRRAYRWWLTMKGDFPGGKTDNDTILALARQLTMPSKLKLKMNGGFKNVEAHYHS